MSELGEFISHLNRKEKKKSEGEEKEERKCPPGMSEQQFHVLNAMKKQKAEIEAKEISFDELKGKVDIKWYGHSGFKIHFLDKEKVHRNIYIDIWIDNKNCLLEDKKECPNDCDLALVTHGQLDHSMHSPFLMTFGKRESRKIIAPSEVGTYYETYRKIPAKYISKM